MNKITSIFRFQLLLVLILLGINGSNAQQVATATYRVTYHATWNAVDHPTNFPNSDHFSGLIGMTHNEDVDLFVEGQLATDGIIRMAELGSKGSLTSEISQYIGNGTAKDILSGSGIGSGTGMVSLEFKISQTHPLVSITSMIAPSPDWFIGVHDVDLFDQGVWVDELTVEVGVYDAGSDSGSTYTSANQSTIPREVIQVISTSPLASNGVLASMGTMVFQRLDSTALPADLSTFSASENGANVTLQWSTLSEVNNAGFGIYKSANAKEFEQISFVSAKEANSARANKYTYTDENVQRNQKYYYRLKQVDTDGLYKYSDVVNATILARASIMVTDLYPNPVGDSGATFFTVTSDHEVGSASYCLFDRHGFVVRTSNLDVNPGRSIFQIHTEGLSQGLYFLQIQVGEEVHIKKLIL